MEVTVWCALALIISTFFILKHLLQKKRNLPPRPLLALPIIGHLHLLKTPLHRSLHSLSNRHGPILSLRFGSRPVVLISSPAIAEQCFTQHDVVFANRPNLIASKILGYNHTTIGFSPYGDHWRNLRRVTAIHIFSATSLHQSSSIRTKEIRLVVQELFQNSNSSLQKVNLKTVFVNLLFNIMTRMAAGERRSELRDLFGLNLTIDICDYVPILRWVGFNGFKKKLEKVNSRDEFLQGMIVDSRSSWSASSFCGQMKTIIEALFIVSTGVWPWILFR